MQPLFGLTRHIVRWEKGVSLIHQTADRAGRLPRTHTSPPSTNEELQRASPATEVDECVRWTRFENTGAQTCRQCLVHTRAMYTVQCLCTEELFHTFSFASPQPLSFSFLPSQSVCYMLFEECTSKHGVMVKCGLFNFILKKQWNGLGNVSRVQVWLTVKRRIGKKKDVKIQKRRYMWHVVPYRFY